MHCLFSLKSTQPEENMIVISRQFQCNPTWTTRNLSIVYPTIHFIYNFPTRRERSLQLQQALNFSPMLRRVPLLVATTQLVHWVRFTQWTPSSRVGWCFAVRDSLPTSRPASSIVTLAYRTRAHAESRTIASVIPPRIGSEDRFAVFVCCVFVCVWGK